MGKKVSVVVPSYNEMANLQKGTLEKVEHFLSRKKYAYEVIIVDDGSTDGSLEFVKTYIKENKNFKLIENKHTGKAGAVTAGVLKATGDFILFTDMDQATPITELDKLLPFSESFDIVIGSRNTTRKGAPFTRKVMSQGMITLRSLLVGLSDIKDTQCGFKLFKKDAAQKVFHKINTIHSGYKAIHGSSVTAGFDVELLYIATQMGYSIKEVPVDWLYVETRRVNPLKDSVDGLLDLFRIRRNIFKKVYG
ncbi:MAG: glycosyltransferase [Candidatus Levyibacteriota bacterium]